MREPLEIPRWGWKEIPMTEDIYGAPLYETCSVCGGDLRPCIDLEKRPQEGLKVREKGHKTCSYLMACASCGLIYAKRESGESNDDSRNGLRKSLSEVFADIIKGWKS